MFALWNWNFRKFRQHIWFPITLFGALGLLTAFGAILLRRFVPPDVPALLGSDSVSTILNILASSMLAVTTFSVSIMVSTFSKASNQATPRATPLLRDDRVTQQVLATFMGAFIYSLTGIIGLSTGVYDAKSRVVLFIATICVLAAIIWQLVRWIGHLTDYGRLTDTIARIEAAAAAAFNARIAQPCLGGFPPSQAIFEAAERGTPILADKIGYIQIVDTAGLQSLAKSAGIDFLVKAIPGTFVHPSAELVRMIPTPTLTAEEVEDIGDKVRNHFAVSATRTFNQDPRFGLIALSEVASRALSPAINDPGTAIDIIGRQVRLLSGWKRPAPKEPICPNLFVPTLRLEDLLTDAFAPIARDGASLIEVQVRLQKALIALATHDPALFGPAALHQSARAMTLANRSLALEEDKALITSLHKALAAQIDAA